MADKKLKPEVAEKFELAPECPIHGGYAGFGQIDLSTLSLDQAESLVANGFTALVPKKVKAAKLG